MRLAKYRRAARRRPPNVFTIGNEVAAARTCPRAAVISRITKCRAGRTVTVINFVINYTKYRPDQVGSLLAVT